MGRLTQYLADQKVIAMSKAMEASLESTLIIFKMTGKSFTAVDIVSNLKELSAELATALDFGDDMEQSVASILDNRYQSKKRGLCRRKDRDEAGHHVYYFR